MQHCKEDCNTTARHGTRVELSWFSAIVAAGRDMDPYVRWQLLLQGSRVFVIT